MTTRHRHLEALCEVVRSAPVTALLGGRQVGKSTLARGLAKDWRRGPVTWFDLEDPADVARLSEPSLTLRALRGLVIIDEVQRLPEIFAILRPLADRRPLPARFLLLGSAAPELTKGSSESLAGRIAFYELAGFALDEVRPGARERLWLRGGLPPSFLARSEALSTRWRRDFVRTFLERDVPQFGITVGALTLRRFWTMLAHYHGQIWNASEFARSFGVSDTAIRHYLDILCGTFAARLLLPWSENLGKRQVRSPKVYLRDPGLLHTLLGIESKDDLLGHPKLGASWEGFALQQVVERLGARSDECYFWATHAGAELDLLVVHGRRRYGFEFKRTDAPKVTPSMRAALVDLRLTRLDVIHAGDTSWSLADKVRAVSLHRLLDDLSPL